MSRRIHRQLTVRGRVQGVGFRAFVRDVAGAFDIRGWVRNNADGSVEIMAQGEQENMRAFIEQIEIGAPSSRVDELDIRDVEGGVEGNGFHVVR